jgi:hypothetical protein
MSKTLSFKGNITDGLQEKIFLRTKDGKTGYKIKKFRLISEAPGQPPTVELVCKLFSKDQTGSISATIDFTESDLLAVATYKEDHGSTGTVSDTIIFDNKVFNQNIFITSKDVSGGTASSNYYLELETITLSDVQSTQLTLENLRTIASR